MGSTNKLYAYNIYLFTDLNVKIFCFIFCSAFSILLTFIIQDTCKQYVYDIEIYKYTYDYTKINVKHYYYITPLN